MTTNAGLLTEERGYRLLHAEGCDEINFSFHSIIPEVYEEIMPPLKYSRVISKAQG
jgi:molybdenum cofactor biosynthesis enzyme MoaA